MPVNAYMPVKTILRDSEFERLMLDYASCGPEGMLLVCGGDKTEKFIYQYGNPPQRDVGEQSVFSTTKPDTQSAYLMAGFEHESDNPWFGVSGNIGVRYVHNEVESVGNFSFAGDTRFYLSSNDAKASYAAVVDQSLIPVPAEGEEVDPNDPNTVENQTNAWKQANGDVLPHVYESISRDYDRVETNSYDFWLPSFNIKIEPIENIIVRYAINKTMTAPIFNDIRAQGKSSIATIEHPTAPSESDFPGVISYYNYESGNTALQPEEGINNDFSVEWYPQKGTSAHVSLFHKSIENQIINRKANMDILDVFGSEPPLSFGEGQEIAVNAPITGKAYVNANETATIKGFEVGGRTYFDNLPGLWSGFGIDANYTYIDSDSPDAFAAYMDGSEATGLPSIGLSKSSYNFTIMYDYDKISARLAYSWRDRYLVTTTDSSTTKQYDDFTWVNTGDGSNGKIDFALPVYAAASGRLDGSISYKINDNFNVKFNVANMTDEVSETEMEILPGKFVTRSYFITDMRYSLHLGMNF